MKPLEAFEYLLAKSLPIVISLPMEEEKGHVVTGRGVCYVEKIHGHSRVTLGRFSPFRLLKQMNKNDVIYASFEIDGKGQECLFTDITVSGNRIVAMMPQNMTIARRRFVRVEPSQSNPVLLFFKFSQSGTHTFAVRDICERGCGFNSEIEFPIKKKIICGILLPEPENQCILSEGIIVYKKEEGKIIKYGLELLIHEDDVGSIRKYIMHREVEIRKIVQEY